MNKILALLIGCTVMGLALASSVGFHADAGVLAGEALDTDNLDDKTNSLSLEVDSLEARSPKSVSRAVLAELFTGTWCTYCQGAEGALDKLANEYPRTQLTVLEWHNGDEYVPPDGSATDREEYYAVDGWPTAEFDGVEEVVGGSTDPDDQGTYDNYKAKIDLRLAIATELTITVDGSQGASTGTMNANITAVGDITATDLKVRFVIYEDHQETVFVDGREYRLRYTVVNGTMVEPITISNGQSIEFTKTFDIDPGWDRSKLGTVVFVQSDATKEVLQSCDYLFPVEKDVGTESIDYPVDGQNYSAGALSIDATIQNYGTADQSDFNVSCEVKEIVVPEAPVVFSDDMESGTDKWTPSDTEWAQQTTIYHSFTTAWFCDYPNPGGDFYLTSIAFDLSTATGTTTFSFWHICITEGGYDFGKIEISKDGFGSSTLLGTFDEDSYTEWSDGSAANTDWKQESYDVSAFNGYATVQVRFWLDADGITAREGWYVDDVYINKTTIETTVFGPVNQTVTTILAQDANTTVSWSYNFANLSDYRLIVKTLLVGDARSDNDAKDIVITINATGSETVTLDLGAGWNLITLPLNTSYTNAEELGSNITSCIEVCQWNATFQSFEVHPVGTGTNNFAIEAGYGYFVQVTATTSFVIEGTSLTEPSVDLATGWNSMGWYNATTTDADSIGKNITGCSAVAIWDSLLGRFITHEIGTTLSNFFVDEGDGYFAFVS